MVYECVSVGESQEDPEVEKNIIRRTITGCVTPTKKFTQIQKTKPIKYNNTIVLVTIKKMLPISRQFK